MGRELKQVFTGPSSEGKIVWVGLFCLNPWTKENTRQKFIWFVWVVGFSEFSASSIVPFFKFGSIYARKQCPLLYCFLKRINDKKKCFKLIPICRKYFNGTLFPRQWFFSVYNCLKMYTVGNPIPVAACNRSRPLAGTASTWSSPPRSLMDNGHLDCYSRSWLKRSDKGEETDL